MQLDADLARILAAVEEEAKARNDQFIAVDLMILAMAKSNGPVGKLIKAAGFEVGSITKAIDDSAKAAQPTVTLLKTAMTRYPATPAI